jgi:hypothetical protein
MLLRRKYAAARNYFWAESWSSALHWDGGGLDWLGYLQNLVSLDIVQYLQGSTGPANRERVDPCVLSETKVRSSVVL